MHKNKTWEKKFIQTDNGRQEAVCPVIISASRSTDIPAFHAEWFINRLKAGYVTWVNPFNRQEQYISFEKTRVVVFWTKNAKPLLPYLDELDKRNINYYFQYTINNYDKDLEPHIPELSERINTFKTLSNKIGKSRIIWRYDPLIITDKISLDNLLSRIKKVGDELYQYTEKLVISFADISNYKKVEDNLKRCKIDYKEFGDSDMNTIAKEINNLNKRWQLEVATCSENIDLKSFGIKHNKCIDDELMHRCFSSDQELMKFLGYSNAIQISMFDNNTRPILKDKGQRKECGCIMSKDIGQYNTCGHLCVYCYANYSENIVKRNLDSISNRSAASILC
ncbi:MAG: DUF1848 domain-containing protein [Candidatus Margulisiibacteriota bacterium]